MKTFITGLIFGICLVPVLLFLYILSGRAPVAAPDRPLPLEEFIARTALHARMNREMPKTVPLAASEATILAGAQVYKRYCGGCHGMLGRPESPGAKGMSPHPPQLLEPDSMVTDDPPGESYWKVRNGIRLSGMPSFQASLSEEQMRQVSILLANADKVSDAVKQELTFTPPPPPAPAAPAKK
ncbi:MAG: cytochrome c [Terriglobia bacterium]